jgi:hypothetical protein
MHQTADCSKYYIMSDPWVDDPERGGEINPFIPDDLQFKVLVVLL